MWVSFNFNEQKGKLLYNFLISLIIKKGENSVFHIKGGSVTWLIKNIISPFESHFSKHINSPKFYFFIWVKLLKILWITLNTSNIDRIDTWRITFFKMIISTRIIKFHKHSQEFFPLGNSATNLSIRKLNSNTLCANAYFYLFNTL